METIRSSADISLLFKEGKRIGTRDLTLIVLRNEKQHDHHGRAAFVAGKKLGNAVWRNRAKRRMRALCREIGAPISGYDMVFLAKKSVNDAPYEMMVKSVKKAIEREGLR